jgi:hypothetical protein
MTNKLDTLTDEQAIHAIKLFYDYAPPEVWEGKQKPSPERVRTIATALVKQASEDIQPAVAWLMQDGQSGNIAARAAVSRLILRQLQQSATLQPAADRAIETALQPRMAVELVTGVFIIALLLTTTKVEPTPDGRKVHFGGGAVDAIKALRLPELIHELPPVIKALPKSIWELLTKMKGA